MDDDESINNVSVVNTLAPETHGNATGDAGQVVAAPEEKDREVDVENESRELRLMEQPLLTLTSRSLAE